MGGNAAPSSGGNGPNKGNSSKNSTSTERSERTERKSASRICESGWPSVEFLRQKKKAPMGQTRKNDRIFGQNLGNKKNLIEKEKRTRQGKWGN